MLTVLQKKFHEALEALYIPGTLPYFGIAISGGIDSLALFLLMDKWCKAHEGRCIPLHVDHGLRASSDADAHTLKAWMAEKKYDLVIKKWRPNQTPTSKIQEKARNSRYALLDQACKDEGLPYLLTAHHQGDDQETFYMRQEKKSTDLGLAGISAMRPLKHCYLLRPLLKFTKKELQTVLGTHPYLDDPTNHQPVFQRNRVRQGRYPHVNLEPYKYSRQQTEAACVAFLASHMELSPAGYALFPLSELSTDSHILLALARVAYVIGHRPYPPSLQSLTSLMETKTQGKSLCGTCCYKTKENLWITPDIRALPPLTLMPGTHKVWDRFAVETNQKIILKPLGKEGWAQIKNQTQTTLPFAVLKTLPSFWNENKVVSVPFLHTDSPQNDHKITFTPTKSILAEIFV